jgi:hypothetical protein
VCSRCAVPPIKSLCKTESGEPVPVGVGDVCVAADRLALGACMLRKSGSVVYFKVY